MSDKIDIIQEESQKQKTPHTEGEESQSIFYLFISLDLVNFTEIKTESTVKTWWDILSQFFKDSKNIIRDVSRLKIWKILGDEIIIMLPIISEVEYEQIPSILLTTMSVTQNIENGMEKKARQNIRIKVTAWLIEARSEDYLENNKDFYNNISFNTSKYSDHKFQDFVGEQMDAGFRLKEASVPGAITLSVELYYIISKLEEIIKSQNTKESKSDNDTSVLTTQKICDNTKLVDFRKFKGVGDGDPYPVLWYSDNWEKIRNLYFTAYFHENALIQSIYTNFNNFHHNISMYQNSTYYKKIVDDADYLNRFRKTKQESKEFIKSA